MKTLDRSPGTAPSAPSPAGGRHAPSRPLRVAVGLAGLALGGCQINAIDLARELRRRGHYVVVFGVQDEVNQSVVPVAEQAGFRVEILPAMSGTASQARHITALVDRHSVSVVHVFAGWLAHPSAVALRSRAGSALVVTNWTMKNERWLPPHAPLIVGTEALGDQARDRQGAPVWVMEPPIDLRADRPDPARSSAFREVWGLRADDLAAVIVSRLDEDMKAEGVCNTIRALDLIDEPSLRLVIVGDGDARQRIGELAENTNERLRRKAITLTGVMMDPRPAYAGADLVLGMGGSALRGLAFGKPVIVLGEDGFSRTFDETTAPYFLRHGFYGIDRHHDPVVHLSDQLRSMTDSQVRARLAAHGLEVARNRFSLTAAAVRLETIYEDALRSAPGWRTRWMDAGYVLGRRVTHRLLPRGARGVIRSAMRARGVAG